MRPRPGDRRPPRPVRTGVVQAIAGAALSVLGVALGIVVLHWLTEPPVPSTVVTERAVAARPVVPSSTAAPTPAPARPSDTARSSSVGGDPLRSGPSAVAPPPAPAPARSASPRPPSLVVPVTVLNNSRRAGLAARASARFSDGGWPVALVGNFRGRIPVTTVYYDPGLEANAQAFASAFDGIVRVRPRFPTLPARGVVVVVTREFAA